MAEPAKKMDDTRLETIIGSLLRIGVGLAAAVVLVGGVAYLIANHALPADRHVFAGEPPELENIAGIVGLAMRGDPRGIIQLGVLLLIATPVARVVFSIYAFWLERDKLYVVITLMVLALLIVGLV